MTAGQSKDFSLTVTAFYLKCVGYWIADNRGEERRRHIALSYTIFMLFLSMVVLVPQLYFTWGDLSNFIYTLCTIITVFLVLFKIAALFPHRQKFLKLLLYSRKNFWHSNYDWYEGRVVANCKRTCSYLICIFCFFAQSTAISYAVVPIVENIGANETDRILPFNMWMNLPFSTTPYFEITFLIQLLGLSQAGLCYICIDNFMCVINLHVASQFRILQYRLTNMHVITNHEKQMKSPSKDPSKEAVRCYAMFKRCVKQHQMLIEFSKHLERIFTVIVLGQVLIFSILMCLDGYLVLMEDAPTMQRLIFVFHITGCMCQLLMFTYSCDCLVQESTAVASAVYSAPWSLLSMNKDGKELRKDMVLVMMRSRVPCCLTAGGFFIVSLETYTRVLSTAVSYFTLLNHY